MDAVFNGADNCHCANAYRQGCGQKRICEVCVTGAACFLFQPGAKTLQTSFKIDPFPDQCADTDRKNHVKSALYLQSTLLDH